MNANVLEWHDGVFENLKIDSDGKIMLTCNLYSAAEAKSRRQYFFNCVGVVSFSSSIDFNALIDSKKAGNINNGRLEQKKRCAVLKLFLCDGYIEIAAKKIIVELINV